MAIRYETERAADGLLRELEHLFDLKGTDAVLAEAQRLHALHSRIRSGRPLAAEVHASLAARKPWA